MSSDRFARPIVGRGNPTTQARLSVTGSGPVNALQTPNAVTVRMTAAAAASAIGAIEKRPFSLSSAATNPCAVCYLSAGTLANAFSSTLASIVGTPGRTTLMLGIFSLWCLAMTA